MVLGVVVAYMYIATFTQSAAARDAQSRSPGHLWPVRNNGGAGVWRCGGTVLPLVCPRPVLVLRGGEGSGEGDGNEYGIATEYGLRSSFQGTSLKLNSEPKLQDGGDGEQEHPEPKLPSVGKGAGLQTELAEDFLRNMPAGLSDWRHKFKVADKKQKYEISSAFKKQFSLEQRKSMAAKISASGHVVPVVAQRLHEGIRLPDTVKPKFSVPAGLKLDKFISILRDKLPWSDLYYRHSHIRLFVKQGREMAVAENMGALSLSLSFSLSLSLSRSLSLSLSLSLARTPHTR